MKKVRIFYEQGQQLGECIYLKELEPRPTKKPTSKKRLALFQCKICNKEFACLIESVKGFKTRSCGCLHDNPNHLPPVQFLHGHSIGRSRTPEYAAWLSMKGRCKGNSPICKKHYTDRGITVCERWAHSFESFYEDMGDRPNENYSLDRINSSMGYNPENCRWATMKEQSGNKSSSILITYNNITQCLMYWARDYGLSHSTLQYRIEMGWPMEKALLPPTTRRISISTESRRQ